MTTVPDWRDIRVSLPAAPDGEPREFAVVEVVVDRRGTTYTLAEADTLRFVDEPEGVSS